MLNHRFHKLVGAIVLGTALTFSSGLGAHIAEAADIAPGHANIQYFGRWDKSDAGNFRCAQGAVYIKANFTGTSLKVKLRDPNNYWRVSIDGSEFTKFRPKGNETVLAENLKPGQHKVLLVRSTEGYMGESQLKGFVIDDDASLEKPDALKKRRLEFVGDSITAGAKNDGELMGSNYNDIEDNDMAYGPQLARMLDADYSVLAKSGEGVIHNWAEKWPGNQVHTADRYQWTKYSDKFEGNQQWDTKQFPVDAVIIAMGTNDFSDNKRKPTEKEFVAGYTRLIETVRKMNPDAKIICTEPVPGWVGKKARKWISTSVENLKAKGDNKLYYIELNTPAPLLEESDYANDSTHPLKSGATKIANYLKDKVAAIMGW